MYLPRLVIPPNWLGISPVSRLVLRRSSIKGEILPSWGGMAPENALSSRYNFSVSMNQELEKIIERL
jgi:hypothetical protein